ncbi:MAG: antitoxin VapB family protein [Nanoarchaeota archaeon]|jgi:predicted CopG family antitoxin|nr:antitoxin VapB family protein [Nanoarchaeota archaeon]
MGTKTLSIMDDAYKLLLLNKMQGESFSDVIRRTFQKKGNLMELAGSMKSISKKDAEKIKKDILALREKSTKDLYKK